MKPAAPLPAACAVLAAAAIAGCNAGVSEARVQAMIDKAIAQQLAKQEAAEAAAPVEAAAPMELPYADEPSQTVNSMLNSADLSFADRQQRQGCESVSQAITAASISPVSPDQSEQLKSYAARCNLRY